MFGNIGDKNFIPPPTRAGGYCRRCKTQHWLGPGNTLPHCLKLMEQFENSTTVNLFSAQVEDDKSLELSCLFGPARGKMFGVMECQRPDGTITILRAFSGQFNGRWLINGWAPPLFEVDDFRTLTRSREREIKELGRRIEKSSRFGDDWLKLRKTRRQLSRDLMRDIHGLYRVNNFRGESVALGNAFFGKSGIPAGTGDCCAPKLIDYAARNKLRPLGISEFYWGLKNKSGNCAHGSFNSACREKCQPLLGFMLCGLDQKSASKAMLPPAGER